MIGMSMRRRVVVAATLAATVCGDGMAAERRLQVAAGVPRPSSAQQSFDESRREMQEMLREIEAGETIYVPYGRSLVPMDREEFVQSLVLASLAPLSAASAGSLDRLSVEEVARLIRRLEGQLHQAPEAAPLTWKAHRQVIWSIIQRNGPRSSSRRSRATARIPAARLPEREPA